MRGRLHVDAGIADDEHAVAGPARTWSRSPLTAAAGASRPPGRIAAVAAPAGASLHVALRTADGADIEPHQRLPPTIQKLLERGHRLARSERERLLGRLGALSLDVERL